ncbi:carbohydrate ABC transporter permease [Eubacteriales bacterium OttesenSCG-928-A19]|nr:carbohydrate ABC transporter permease [Eubacteriales bacterium OttesenSCG-928-A19]
MLTDRTARRRPPFTARKFGLFAFELLMLAITAVFLLPLYFLIITAFKTSKELIFTPLAWPNSFYTQNFVDAWHNVDMGRAFLNTAFVALSAVLGRMLISSMAAFTIAKKPSRFHEFLYIFFLAGIMIPIYTMLVPMIKQIKDLGLMNSLPGLIVVYMGTGVPFSVFLLTGFTRSLPNELIEAAVIDGCGVYRIFARVVFPLLKPVLSTLFLLDFLSIWNDFLLPMLLLSTNNLRTITLAMYNFYSEYGSRWEQTFAGYTLAILPLVVLFLLLQKNIVAGILVGAVKG